MAYKFETLDQMIKSNELAMFLESKLGNDLFINDAGRAERMHDAAEYGCGGSTHQEVIDDWRDFMCSLSVDDGEEWCTDYDISEEIEEKISAEIDACEAWHIENGSINNQLG